MCFSIYFFWILIWKNSVNILNLRIQCIIKWLGMNKESHWKPRFQCFDQLPRNLIIIQVCYIASSVTGRSPVEMVGKFIKALALMVINSWRILNLRTWFGRIDPHNNWVTLISLLSPIQVSLFVRYLPTFLKSDHLQILWLSRSNLQFSLSPAIDFFVHKLRENSVLLRWHPLCIPTTYLL